MTETNMPVAEAAVVADTPEVSSYELAFHVLPTVAEGEVSTVFESLKAVITKAGGEVFDEETPERFELAYEIVQSTEGKNRKYASAYFGWVRFRIAAEPIAIITEEVEADTNILRHLLIRLTRVEEQHPFRFHEILASEKQVQNIEESDVLPDLTPVTAETTDSAKPEVEDEAEEGTEKKEA